MIIEIDDWKFDVDLDVTMQYSTAEAAEHCTCGYCRNFYAAVDKRYPNLRRFLARFGVDVEAPDALIPYEPTLLEGFFAVCGRVLRFGMNPMTVDGLRIYIAERENLHVNVFCPEPYFVLNTDFMELGWMLEEPMKEVISPANEPSFLQNMTDRILGILPKENQQ